MLRRDERNEERGELRMNGGGRRGKTQRGEERKREEEKRQGTDSKI